MFRFCFAKDAIKNYSILQLFPVIMPNMNTTLKNFFPDLSIVTTEEIETKCPELNFTRLSPKILKRLNRKHPEVLHSGHYMIFSQPNNYEVYDQYREDILKEFRWASYLIHEVDLVLNQIKRQVLSTWNTEKRLVFEQDVPTLH